MTAERNRLVDLNELASTNEQLVENQAAQLDALRGELAAAQARAVDAEQLRQLLANADARLVALEGGAAAAANEAQALRRQCETSAAALADERRAHDDAQRVAAHQCDELRGLVRLAHAAAQSAQARVDALLDERDQLATACDEARRALAALPPQLDGQAALERELVDAYRRLEASEA